MPRFHSFHRSVFFASITGCLSSLALALPSQAFTVNFGTWSTIGDTSVPGAGQITLTATDDLNAISADLQTFLNVDAAALDLTGFAWEGSAVKQIFTVSAGDAFSFNWNFTSPEIPPTQFNDFAFFAINDAIFKLADVNDGNAASNPFSFTFNTAGTYQLAFGVIDIEDVVNNSTLIVSNANLTTATLPPSGTDVPEPFTILGTGAAIGFSALFHKEKAKRQKRKKIST